MKFQSTGTSAQGGAYFEGKPRPLPRLSVTRASATEHDDEDDNGYQYIDEGKFLFSHLRIAKRMLCL